MFQAAACKHDRCPFPIVVTFSPADLLEAARNDSGRDRIHFGNDPAWRAGSITCAPSLK